MNLKYSELINRRVPEANIQAEFYMLCRRHDIRVLLEVKYENCRFDCLVFLANEPFAIVEVKNYMKRVVLNGKTNQVRKYSKYGLPVIGVVSPKHIYSAFNDLLGLLNERHGSEIYPLYNLKQR